ncbi:hypothetical protein OKA05_09835 [Luteolibacter arcticus]|uniref:CHASE2 domain-containing protein n=1 Tax=Luteolibacter arcticus TaxID=1581411 RepID=A0ABT3GHJ6_9BACT|nr:hypothetical protein [Luteolibacter arcticus]MCW1922850.1 hypothetical protein [Luteolibacter arcticus]
MNTPSRRTFTSAAILLGVGLFALGGASLIPPLRGIERWIVKKIAVSMDPVDTILDGRGSQDEPWTGRKAVPPVVPPPPRLLTIDEDPEHWFSTSPLAPVDHALIFARLADVGHKTLGIGHLMAWDTPEPLAMEALRKQLDRYNAAVLALPLARGAAPEPVAAPFLRWSIETKDAKGKVSALPQVNRVSIPNAELGGQKTLAGFSLLENEKDPGDGTQALLAQWGDRVIFAFPLAVEIAAQGLTPADVLVHVGREVRLGRDGPVIPIDGFGRGPVVANVQTVEAPAMRLIYEKNSLPATEHPLITRDVRAELPPAEKAWSDRLAASVQAMRTAQRFQQAVTLPRPDALMELALMVAMVFFGTWATCQKHVAWRIFTALMLAGLGAQLLYLFASRQNLWLPPLAILSPGITAVGLAFMRKASVAKAPVAAPATGGSVVDVSSQIVMPPPEPILLPEPEPEPEPYYEPEPEPAPAYVEEEAWPAPVAPPAEVEPAAKPARKAAKKATAKKAATKAPAKKAAKKEAVKEAKKAPAKKAAKKAARKKTAASDSEESGPSADETAS